MIQNRIAEFRETALIPLHVGVKHVAGVFFVAVHAVEIKTDKDFVRRAVFPLYGKVRPFDRLVVDFQRGNESTSTFFVVFVVEHAVFVIFVNGIAVFVFVGIGVQVRFNSESEVSRGVAVRVENIDVEVDAHIITAVDERLAVKVFSERRNRIGKFVYRLLSRGMVFVVVVVVVVDNFMNVALHGIFEFAPRKHKRQNQRENRAQEDFFENTFIRTHRKVPPGTKRAYYTPFC